MAKRDSCDWIHRYKFALWERLRTANERVSNRRERVRDIGMSFGITATAPEERARQAAALTPTEAARWIGADVTIVQLDEPQGWEAIQQPLRKFRRWSDDECPEQRGARLRRTKIELWRESLIDGSWRRCA